MNEGSTVSSRYFLDLGNKHSEVRARAAARLRQFVEAEARFLSFEASAKFFNGLTGRLFDLVNSVDVYEKLGGISVMDELIDVKVEGSETLLGRFAHCLRILFQQSASHTDEDFAVLEAAARALGHLARRGGALTDDIVGVQVAHAFEWLRTDKSKRLAAVFILKTLSQNTPTLFSVYVEQFLQHIWIALRDPKPQIRDAAVEALRACLVDIANRDTRWSNKCYKELYLEAMKGFEIKNATGPEVHASLLVIGELLFNTGEFMISRFKGVCEIVFRCKDNKHQQVIQGVIALCPRLAALCPDAFMTLHMTHTLEFLLGQTRGPNRAAALVALGEIAGTPDCQVLVVPKLAEIMDVVNDGLNPKYTRGPKALPELNAAALACVTLLAHHLANFLLPYGTGLVERLFDNGLTPALVQALTALSTKLPVLLLPIQDRLLSTVWCILAASGTRGDEDLLAALLGSPTLPSSGSAALHAKLGNNKPYGCPLHTTAVVKRTGGLKSEQSENEIFSVSSTILALQTLGEFNFDQQAQRVIILVHSVAVSYLDHQNIAIRKQAAECLAVLVPRLSLFINDVYTSRVILLILQRLVSVAIADSSPIIRSTILRGLGKEAPRFGKYLSQAEILQVLYVALNDEIHAVRELAITLLGSLAPHNPALVLPALRKTLIQQLAELQELSENTAVVEQEETSRLLGLLLSSCRSLVKPYVAPILNVLVPKLADVGKFLIPNRHSQSKVGSHVLETLGQLATICGEDLLPHLPRVFPLLIHTLQDKMSNDQTLRAATRTLCQLLVSTGNVFEPMLQYPSLLPSILNVLKREHTGELRVEVLRVLGTIGAFDAFKYKELTADKLPVSKQVVARDVSRDGFYQNVEDLYPEVAIAALMKVLNDPGLVQHHSMVVTAVMFIFRGLGIKAVPFLEKIIPAFLAHLSAGIEELVVAETFLSHLTSMVNSVQRHIKSFIPEIVALCFKVWDNPRLLSSILPLLEALATACNHEFLEFLPALIPNLLRALKVENDKELANKALHTLRVLSTPGYLNGYLFVLFPTLILMAESEDTALSVRLSAIYTIARMTKTHEVLDHASRILHAFCRILSSNSTHNQLLTPCLHVVCDLIRQLGFGFLVFEPMVKKCLSMRVAKYHYEITGLTKVYANYKRLLCKLTRSAEALDKKTNSDDNDSKETDSFPLLEAPTPRGHDIPASMQVPSDLVLSAPAIPSIPSSPNWRELNNAYKLLGQGIALEVSDDDDEEWKNEIAPPRTEMPVDAQLNEKLHVSQSNLRKAWTAGLIDHQGKGQRSTVEDWVVWMRGFSIELLKESPSSALRTCSALAHKFPPFAWELFNVSFLSCWSELDDQLKDDLINQLEDCFKSKNIPSEIVQTLMNVVEFMDYHGKRLPIDIRNLCGLADRCDAYAKVLQCKETEFQTSPASCLQALISINNKLQLPEAAQGILRYAQIHHPGEVKESWYEKLDRWSDALGAYETRQMQDPSAVDCTVGRMRCLQALGEWERLDNLSASVWQEHKDPETLRIVAPLGANAACHLRQWGRIEQYLPLLEKNDFPAHFYRAIVDVHANKIDSALQNIQRAFVFLGNNLVSLLSDSYSRAYRSVVQLQQLIELEEVIQCKKDPESQSTIRKLWRERLHGCQRSVGVWQQILSIRSLVLTPQQNIDEWLDFAGLCRKSSMLHLSAKVLTELLGQPPKSLLSSKDPLPTNPHLAFASLKHLYEAGHREPALTRLQELVQLPALDIPNSTAPQVISDLKSRIYLRIGRWSIDIMENHSGTRPQWRPHVVIPQALQCFEAATRCTEKNYRAWHEWAVLNFRVVNEREPTGLSLLQHVVIAIHAFCHAICLQKNDGHLQDVLRLLALLFQYGARPEVGQAFTQGAENVSVDTWLAVIPQLIARIHTAGAVRNMIHQLLCKIGTEHPQALVYPLTVASKSHSAARQAAAMSVLNDMRQHSPTLVEQALLVSGELVRVAILWHELWQEAIETAFPYMFGRNKNAEGIFMAIQPIHAIMEQGPHTIREVAFQQMYGRELREAGLLLAKFKRTGTNRDLLRAWDLYSNVLGRIAEQAKSYPESELNLLEVSPKLLAAQNMQLAVPGLYRAGGPIVHIARFGPLLKLIESKQHPRKLSIFGSDGREYGFLLKGHEDLRQDERVMQLFGLVNMLLNNDRETAKNELNIHRYNVIPLSPNSGILEWVPNSETLHAVIKSYRDMRKVLLNVEQHIMSKMSKDYPLLTLLQKVEVFEHALAVTPGEDLKNVMVLRSPNAEVWLNHRTSYIRSLAVMSMVGYVLGLGDRHPCNLMVASNSGKIVHIDFGDCFEAAMIREKFPEKVPFRLTRMLVQAMEVNGVEGTFRATCESVMAMLRKHKHSVMAVLEAFVYDPLIGWRILETRRRPEEKGEEKETTTLTNGEDVLPRRQSVVIPLPEERNNAPTEPTEEFQNLQALAVVRKVESKLKGTDFNDARRGESMPLTVATQVHHLICEATSSVNLCQAYTGWCPFW